MSVLLVDHTLVGRYVCLSRWLCYCQYLWQLYYDAAVCFLMLVTSSFIVIGFLQQV